MVKKMIFFVLLYINMAFPYLCRDTTMLKIRQEVIQILNTYGKTSSLNRMNILWPTCKEIDEHKINKKELNNEYLEQAHFWIKFYQRGPIIHIDSLIVLKKMENKNDWIIANGWWKGSYYQYIDSKTLTILIKMNIDIADTNNFEERYFPKINNFVLLRRFSNECMDFNRCLNVKVTFYDSTKYMEGEIKWDSTSGYYNRYKGTVRFWTNGRYIAIDIEKVEDPYRDLLGYWAKKTIGGIPYTDPRPFIRFDSTKRFDFESEMHRVFPWLKDTIRVQTERSKYPVLDTTLHEHLIERDTNKR
jgi:hypothetical protein